MFLQHPVRDRLLSRRWGSGTNEVQNCGPLRLAAVCRPVVAKATKLSAKGATEDVEDLLTYVPQNGTLKAKSIPSNPSRSIRVFSPPQKSANGRHREQDSVADVDAADEDDNSKGVGFRSSALRDATATASTSGRTHLHGPPGSLSHYAAKTRTTAPPGSTRRILGASSRTAGQAHVRLAAAEDDSEVTEKELEASLLAALKRQLEPVSLDALSGSLPGQGNEGRQHHSQQEQQPDQSDTLQDQQHQQPEAAGSSGDKDKEAASSGHHPLPAGVTAERDKDMYHELRSCEHWRDVLDVVADELESLSLRTAVQALTRLNALSRSGPAEARAELTRTEVFQDLVRLLHSQVPRMNNVQLSNTLYALTQLGVQLDQVLLSSYFVAAAGRADNFYPRDIATMFSAAAATKADPPLEALNVLGYRATCLLESGKFDGRSIPTLLHACTLLGYKNDYLAQAAAQQLAAPGVLGSMTPQGVANSVWALARMGTYHPPAVEAALAAFAAAPDSYKPQECANLLWAMTAFRHHPGVRFASLAKCLLQRLPQLRAADLATLLYALGFFKVAPGPQVLGRIASRVKALLLTTQQEDSTSSTTSTASGLPSADRDSQSGRASSSSSPSSRVNMVELCNMYWGLALLGEVGGSLFAQVQTRLVEEWERCGGDVPDSLKRMTFQAFLASRLVESMEGQAPGLPPLMLDACKREWATGVAGPETMQKTRRTVESVAEILQELRVAYDKRRPTGDGLAMIDLAVKAGPETYVALQVLEETHTCANDSRQLLGTTVLQRQLLEKNGWEVRFLIFSDLDKLQPDLRPLFVADLLRRLGVRARTPTRPLPPLPGAAAAGAGVQALGAEGQPASGAATRSTRGAAAALPLGVAPARRAPAEREEEEEQRRPMERKSSPIAVGRRAAAAPVPADEEEEEAPATRRSPVAMAAAGRRPAAGEEAAAPRKSPSGAASRRVAAAEEDEEEEDSRGPARRALLRAAPRKPAQVEDDSDDDEEEEEERAPRSSRRGVAAPSSRRVAAPLTDGPSTRVSSSPRSPRMAAAAADDDAGEADGGDEAAGLFARMRRGPRKKPQTRR